MNQTPLLVTQPETIRSIAQKLANEKVIALDTEFIRETTFFPKVALIQVASREETWLVDPTVLSKEELQPLFDLFLRPDILKVMHATHADQECFYTSYGFVVAPVLDTAIGAALLGMGDNMGLGKLLKELLDINLPKGRARARWLTRPLPRELLEYAELDVKHLVNLGEVLKEKLSARNRMAWALEESATETKVFEVTPEEMAFRMFKSGQVEKNIYPVLLELVRWREKRARTADMPRGWVADNETLMALSKSRPATVDELRHFRGLNGREVDKSGKYILEAMERGKKMKVEIPPRGERVTLRSDAEEHILDLVHSYVSYLANRLEIASRFLLSSHKSAQLVIHADKEINHWVEHEIISPHASALIGEDLKALLSGKRALAIRNKQVEILTL